MILKKRVSMIGCCLAFVILLVLTYSLYKEKRMHEQYLTMNIRQDIVDMKSAIINNDLIFTRILENGKIINEMVEDGEQARQLHYNLRDMSQIINKYNLMNLSFSQEASWLVKPAPRFINHLRLEDIWPHTLQRMQMTFERLDIVGDFESKVINESEWPQILYDLEQETRAYFKEKKVDFVEDDVWREALNPRHDKE